MSRWEVVMTVLFFSRFSWGITASMLPLNKELHKPQPVPDALDLRSTMKAKAAKFSSVAVKESIASP